MTSKLSKIEISFDGGSTYTDVSTYCKGWTYKGTLDNIADIANVKLNATIKDTYTLEDYLYIKLYEGWSTSTDRLVFWGVITRITDEYSYINIECADKTYLLLKSKQVAVYNSSDSFGGVISAIAKNIIENAGLSATVVTTDATTNLDQFKVNDDTNALERLTALAKAVDYNILYDPEDDIVYFVSKGYFTNATVLTIPDDTTERPKWDKDATRLFNDLTLKGGTSSGVRTKLASGDGSETTFAVDLTPTDSVKVEVDIVGTWTEQVQGTPGVSSTYDYYIDKANKQIIFNSGSEPAVGVDNVRITISAQIPPSVNLIDETSIASYNLGLDSEGNYLPIKETIILDDIFSVSDAFVRGQKILDLFKEPFYYTSVPQKPSKDVLANYKLGEVIAVTDDNVGFDERSFVITEIEREWPGGGPKLTLGDKAYKIGQFESMTDARLKRLEGLLSGDYEVLNATRGFFNSLTVTTTSASYQETCICDSFILGHPVNGLLGMGQILDDFEAGFTADWSTSNCAIAEELTEYLTGFGCCKLTPTNDCSITTTQSFGDLSSYTGESSGTPSQGTIGLWVNNNTSTISEVRLKIGSDSSNYAYYTGSVYQSTLGFDWQDDWTYLVFDLDVPDSVTGTPDWTTCNYAVIEIDSDTSDVILVDYFTISSSNIIGLNGLGSRTMVKSAVSII